MNCIHCGKGIADGVALFRQNGKGIAGIWACREHNGQPIDPVVDEIVTAVSATKETK